MKAKKAKAEVNKNPHRNLPLGTELQIQGVTVKVAYQNAGFTWFSPVKDDTDWGLFRGLCVFQARWDGTIREVYTWG